MEIKIWDKKSDINNISLEKLLSYRNDIKNAIETGEEVFLVYKGTPRVEDILFEYSVRSKYSLGMGISCEQVAQKYLEIIQKTEEQTKQEQLSLQKQQQEIEALKKQNAELSYLIMQGGAM